LQSSEEKLLARRFRNPDESSETAAGMKGKKDMWRNCSSLKSLTFNDHACFQKKREAGQRQRESREKSWSRDMREKERKKD
jgi:hypothetical protein